MVVTAPAAPSLLAGPSTQGRSASRIASDRRGATWVSPEKAVFEQLDRAGGTCIGRARPHRGDTHRGRRRFSGHTRNGRYCRARYYHPELQRFISEDPIGFAGGDANLYAYVANQPTLFRDPTGHELVAATYGASGFAGVTTYMGRLSSVGLAGVASGAYGVSTTSGGATGQGIAVTAGGVALNGPAQSNSFVLGLGFSKLGYGFMYSNADSFAQLTGAADTTLIALGPIGFQYDVSTDAATGRTIRNFGVSPALGLGIARFSTLSAGRDVKSYPCPYCPVEAALPGGGGFELRPMFGRK
jgi:RHS repeat-associated protein